MVEKYKSVVVQRYAIMFMIEAYMSFTMTVWSTKYPNLKRSEKRLEELHGMFKSFEQQSEEKENIFLTVIVSIRIFRILTVFI